MSLLLVEGYRGIATADSDDRFVFSNSSSKDATIATASPRWASGGYVASGLQAGEMLRLYSLTWPLYIECGMKRVAGHVSRAPILGLYGWQGPNYGVDSAASFGYLSIFPNGAIALHKKTGANTNTVVAISTKHLKCDVWVFLQVKWNIDSRANLAHGQVEVYVDDQLWITYDDDLVHNTLQGDYLYDPLDYTFLQLLGANDVASTSTGNPLFTDIVVCDSSGTAHIGFQGHVEVETVRPDGAGNYSNFTPSAGSNYQNVDETTPDGDTTYNHSSTTDHRDSYTMSALARAAGTVKAVMFNMVAKTPEAGIHNANFFIREAGADMDDSDLPIAQDYKHRRTGNFVEGISGPWTITLVNALELGVRRR